MLASERWSSLGKTWGEEDRKELVYIWHELDGQHNHTLFLRCEEIVDDYSI